MADEEEVVQRERGIDPCGVEASAGRSAGRRGYSACRNQRTEAQ